MNPVRHLLEPSRATLHGRWSRDLPPALTVESGDRVRCRTLDVSWGLEARRADGSARAVFEPREMPRDDGPCLLGPIAVRGAAPGQTLEIHLESIVPAGYGWTFAGEIGYFNTELNRALGVTEGEPELLRWDLDAVSMTGTSHLGDRVRLAPFLGTLGLCPAGDGWQAAWPPRRTLGNTDCRELVAGTVLYVPVEVEGALVSLGDGHATQGDGEVAGTAIECPMGVVDLRLVLRRDLRLDRPRALSPRGWITFGFDESLDRAVEQALGDMIALVMETHGVGRKHALALMSAVVDVRFTQLVNGVRGVHAILPEDAITRVGRGDVFPVDRAPGPRLE